MKRSQLFLFAAFFLAAAPAWAQPTAKKAAAGSEDGITTVVITVSAKGEDLYGVTIKGAKVEDIRAPKGWVGISSGTSAMFRTGENPVKAGSAVAFKLMTSEPSAGMTVSFRGKEDAVGEPIDL